MGRQHKTKEQERCCILLIELSCACRSIQRLGNFRNFAPTAALSSRLPLSKEEHPSGILVGFNNPQELFRVCLFVVEWLHKRRSKGRKVGMESQSSPLEERSKIRYYELPSLPTFAKKILSIRAQSELEQGDAI